jgi:hypothetical protein
MPGSYGLPIKLTPEYHHMNYSCRFSEKIKRYLDSDTVIDSGERSDKLSFDFSSEYIIYPQKRRIS